MGRDTFYELTRRSIPATKNDGIFLSWHDSVINVRTDKGMNFFEFSYNLECLEKEIDIFEYSIPSPKNSPAAAVCKSKFINNEMKNYDYTEMITDSSFWPHNKALTQEMTSVIKSVWSPPNFIKNKSVLAMLNSVGGVEIISQQQYQWKTFLDLSPHIENSLKHDTSPKNFEELKKSVYILETCSVCWAPKLSSYQSCYFVTAQKNGVILIWKIFNDSKPTIIGKINSDMSEIINMIWIPKTETQLWLICADIIGQVNAFVIQIVNENISLLETHVLWEYKDRMIGSYLNYTTINGNVILFYSKHRHFVAQAIDNKCNIISQYVNNINDYRISDLTGSADGFYLATINVKIFKMSLNMSGTSLVVDVIPIEIKEQYQTYELHSISFSNTNTLCVLGMVDRKLLCRKEVFKIDLIFVSTESKLDALIPMFLNNPDKKLTNYWDCIEALRHKIYKMKTMPSLDYDSLYTEACNNIYKLKIYLLLLIFYLKMREMALVSSDFTLPNMSIDATKEKILLLHAQAVIRTLYNKYQKDGELSRLEKESYAGCVNYLSFYSKKYKTNVAIDKNMMSVVKKTNYEYVCQSCDDKILAGFMCKSGHLSMYCMLSFTPITSDDYLVCKCCGSTARTDFSVNDLLCVFCDQYLIKPD